MPLGSLPTQVTVTATRLVLVTVEFWTSFWVGPGAAIVGPVVSVAAGTAVPVPLRAMVFGFGVALFTMLKLPTIWPAECGVNVTLMAQPAPRAKVPMQLLV